MATPNKDPMANAADMAMTVSTFYNHCTMQGVPDAIAANLTTVYLSRIFDVAIAAHNAQVTQVDYAAIRDYVNAALRKNND